MLLDLSLMGGLFWASWMLHAQSPSSLSMHDLFSDTHSQLPVQASSFQDQREAESWIGTVYQQGPVVLQAMMQMQQSMQQLQSTGLFGATGGGGAAGTPAAGPFPGLAGNPAVGP